MVRDKTKIILRLHLVQRASCSGLVLCCLLVISLFTRPVVAEEILVITHQDAPISHLTLNKVANLFLGVGQNNHDLTPFDVSDKKLRQNFYREVTGMSLPSIRARRARQVFTGRGHPPVMLRADEIEQKLSEKPGAVTYISAEQLPAGSKILLTLESGGQK